MAQHPHPPAQQKTPPAPYVKVTIVFRDVLQKPIEGLSVQIKPSADAQPAPQWITGPFADAGLSLTPGATAALAAILPPTVPKSVEVITDKDGYAMTIHNAARNRPIDVLVKNHRGEYKWKATVTPKKDISAFTIVSPEYHLEATTKLTPKEGFEQDLNLPVLKKGEVMTIERLVKEFGPYIGWSQKVTEQGKVKKDVPTRHEEVKVDEKTKKEKKIVTIEHHYKVVDTGKPGTLVFNVLGSKLNYPKTFEISEKKYAEAAKTLGCEAAAIKAIAMTESHGTGFCDNGLPKILYERQVFFRSLLPKNKRNEKSSLLKKEPNPYPAFPNLCLPIQGGYTAGETDDRGWSHSDEKVMHQYERFVQACALNLDAAIMACSWGAFQVLAFFYEEMGYASPTALANLVMQGVDEQFDLFIAYVNMNSSAKKALQTKDWESFAYYYNGQGYPPKYPVTMKKFYDIYK
jgi:N-acetylmuramidase